MFASSSDGTLAQDGRGVLIIADVTDIVVLTHKRRTIG
jgi:hypothetical protein